MLVQVGLNLMVCLAHHPSITFTPLVLSGRRPDQPLLERAQRFIAAHSKGSRRQPGTLCGKHGAPSNEGDPRLLPRVFWILASGPQSAHGHGYLASPRSRNLVAHEETVWWPQTANDPEPETCPHCLNRGGTLARCGLVGALGSERNYDAPKNALGREMPVNIQANYTQGQDVTLNVSLTAHHKGHFVFSACPISPGEVPTQECFDANRLTFVEDLLHGANYDPNYPERAYIAPPDNPNYVLDVLSTSGVMDFSYRMRLPTNLYGDLVLIQWYYLTANSCYHEGYREYDWPASWNIDPTSSMLCGDVSPDGSGVPEQFWNCVEVFIEKGPDQTANAAFLVGSTC